MPKQAIFYADDNGEEPFTEWLDNLRDLVGRQRILTERGPESPAL
jgi:hypothetical protein